MLNPSNDPSPNDARRAVPARALEVRVLRSLGELRAAQGFWDTLAARTPGVSPLTWAEPLALWVEQFAEPRQFRAVVVSQHDRWLAALPVVGRRSLGLVSYAELPLCEWSSGGALLGEPDSESPIVFDRLLWGLRTLGWSLFRMRETDVSSPLWATFLDRCRRQGFQCEYQHEFTSGRVRLANSWDAFLASRTKKHRANLRRNWSRLQESGDVQLELISRASPDDVSRLLRRGFEIELRSWKATQQTTVLQTPGMFEFHCRQAEALAARGQLRLAFLTLSGQPIAFDYGFTAGDTYFRSKIAYDEAFSNFSPGQLVAARVMENLHHEKQVSWVDFMGPMSDALSKWTTDTYQVGRILLATPGPVGRAMFGAYRATRGWRRLNRRPVATHVADERPAETADLAGV